MISPYRVRTRRQALRFINGLGFCYAFTAGPGNLPGLFDVLATRSIDRMWGWTWQWKDELATQKKVFYGKVLHRKPTFISLDYLPHFFALAGNVGEPDDYLQAYREGRLPRLAKEVFEYLRAHGPCSTWVLRTQFVARGDRSGPFHRALGALQEHCLIAKVGEQERGSYSFIWDTFERWLPQTVRAAGHISAATAAGAVLDRYLRTVGAAPPGVAAELFAWPPPLFAEARRGLAGQTVDAGIDGTPVLAHARLVTWIARRARRGRRDR